MLEIPSLPALDKDPDKLIVALNEFFQNLVTELGYIAWPGTVAAYAGAEIPEGWLACDGSTYEIEDYKNLAKAIGQAWGGTGTQFQVPDFRDKVLYGESATRPITTAYGRLDTISGTVNGVAVKYIIKT